MVHAFQESSQSFHKSNDSMFALFVHPRWQASSKAFQNIVLTLMFMCCDAYTYTYLT